LTVTVATRSIEPPPLSGWTCVMATALDVDTGAAVFVAVPAPEGVDDPDPAASKVTIR
jgi:hypothetical protein